MNAFVSNQSKSKGQSQDQSPEYYSSNDTNLFMSVKKLWCRIWRHDWDEAGIECAGVYCCQRCEFLLDNYAPYPSGLIERAQILFYHYRDKLKYKIKNLWRRFTEKPDDCPF